MRDNLTAPVHDIRRHARFVRATMRDADYAPQIFIGSSRVRYKIFFVEKIFLVFSPEVW